MNRQMLTGVVAGIGVAIAGGVAGFTLLGESAEPVDAQTAEIGDANVETTGAAVPRQTAAPAAPARSQTVTADAGAVAETPVAEECWDEEVVVQAEPRDEKAIAGTAAGALIGGALGDKLGDDNDLVTAAGAAAGAYLGRRAQKEYQENQTTTTTERRCAPVGTR